MVQLSPRSLSAMKRLSLRRLSHEVLRWKQFACAQADSRLGWHPRARRRSTQLLLSNAGVEPTAPDKAWCVGATRSSELAERSSYRTSAGVLLTRRLD